MGQIQNLYEIKEKQCAKKRNGKEEEKQKKAKCDETYFVKYFWRKWETVLEHYVVIKMGSQGRKHQRIVYVKIGVNGPSSIVFE